MYCTITTKKCKIEHEYRHMDVTFEDNAYINDIEEFKKVFDITVDDCFTMFEKEIYQKLDINKLLDYFEVEELLEIIPDEDILAQQREIKINYIQTL